MESPLRLCGPRRQASLAHLRGKPGFLTLESGCGRETDCLLEGDGFELPVPREKKSRNLCIPLEVTDLVWLRPPEGLGALAPRVEEFEDADARTPHRTRRGLRPSSADGGRPFTKSSPRCPPDTHAR